MSTTKKSDAKPSKLIPRPNYEVPARGGVRQTKTDLDKLRQRAGGQGKDLAEWRPEVVD